jgi:hypothetical protein
MAKDSDMPALAGVPQAATMSKVTAFVSALVAAGATFVQDLPATMAYG